MTCHVFPIHVISYQAKCFSINIAKFSLARCFNLYFLSLKPFTPARVPSTLLTVTSNQVVFW